MTIGLYVYIYIQCFVKSISASLYMIPSVYTQTKAQKKKIIGFTDLNRCKVA